MTALTPLQSAIRDAYLAGMPYKVIQQTFNISAGTLGAHTEAIRRKVNLPKRHVGAGKGREGPTNPVRCPQCRLILPCRTDGLAGPCDARMNPFDQLHSIGRLFHAVDMACGAHS